MLEGTGAAPGGATCARWSPAGWRDVGRYAQATQGSLLGGRWRGSDGIQTLKFVVSPFAALAMVVL